MSMIDQALARRLGARVAASGRSALLMIVLCASAVALAQIFGREYPVERWLFWRYALVWACTAVFSLAALSIGNLVVTALSPRGERLDGHVTLSFATGVFVFFLVVFLFGLLGWLHPVAFFVIPFLLLAPGADRLVNDFFAWRARSHDRSWFRPLSLGETIFACAGVVALVALYLPVLVPENAAYDARWYHLGLAEHFVAEGSIRRLPEGPVAATIPSLPAMLYTWALLLPGSSLFDRVELAAHLEFAILLFTLPGIPALVRYLVPAAKARVAWAALFLFPSIFVYDSTLAIAADHISALWAIPAYLAMVRALPSLRPRSCVLLAIQLCGLMMSKYTAVIVALFPILAIVLRGLQLGWHRLRGRGAGLVWLSGPLAAAAAGLLLTTPHWLKNWVWYGDPLYPMLHRHMRPRPWGPNAAFYWDAYQALSWGAVGPWEERLRGMFHALYDYSYELYHWPDFHGRFPIVGSLFTFGLIALPFVRRTKRIWVLVLATHLGIAFWYLNFHNDRYLVPLLPWMAAGVVAIATLSWREGWLARLGTCALMGLQLVWGLDIAFWPTHKMTGKAGVVLAAEFLSKAFQKQLDGRLDTFQDFVNVGQSLPRSAKLVLHHEHLRVGFGVMTVTDWLPVELGIMYGRLGTSRAVHRLFKEYGVTHVTWLPEVAYGDVSLADELVFHTYVSRHVVHSVRRGSRMLAEVAPEEPSDDATSVFYFGCSGTYANGLYEVSDLNVWPVVVEGWDHSYPPPRQPVADDAQALIDRASSAIVQQGCPGAPRLDAFERIAHRDTTDFMLRKVNAAP